jgi:hypothetical protein
MLCILPSIEIFALKADSEKGKEADASVRRIAFVGVGAGNLHSNYFSDDMIAGKMNVPEDSINETFNRHFYEILNEACLEEKKPDVVYCCFDDSKTILESVAYNRKGDEMESDFSGVPQELLNGFFEKTSTGCLVLIDQYYIKKEGYPYHNISHIITCSAYDRNGEVIFRGRHRFSSLDMEDFDQYAKQFSKIAHKLLAKIDPILHTAQFRKTPQRTALFPLFLPHHLAQTKYNQ